MKTIFISLVFFICVKCFCQEGTLKGQLNFDTVILFKTTQFSNSNSFQIKNSNGTIYIVCHNYLSKKNNLLLFKIDLSNYKIDTLEFLSKMAFDYTYISDFNILNNKLYLFNMAGFCIVDLLNYNQLYVELPTKIKRKYSHFNVEDSNTFYMYDWVITDKLKEEKNAIEYNFRTQNINILTNYEINGLHFLTTDPSKKYIDVAEKSLVKMFPDEYEISYLNLSNKRLVKIKRDLDTSNFIKKSFLDDLRAQYFIHATYAILDSLTNYEVTRTQLNSIRVFSDSLIFVSYQNISPMCKFRRSNVLDFLDIWKYNKQKDFWYLFKKDLRLNNAPYCKMFLPSDFNKSNLPFSSIDNWVVSENKLIFTKLLSNKIDMESSDMSEQLFNINFDSPQKFLYIVVYKLE